MRVRHCHCTDRLVGGSRYSLPAYMQVTNFCYIFGRRNGGRLIRGTAYTRVYTVTHSNYNSDLLTTETDSKYLTVKTTPQLLQTHSIQCVVIKSTDVLLGENNTTEMQTEFLPTVTNNITTAELHGVWIMQFTTK